MEWDYLQKNPRTTIFKNKIKKNQNLQILDPQWQFFWTYPSSVSHMLKYAMRLKTIPPRKPDQTISMVFFTIAFSGGRLIYEIILWFPEGQAWTGEMEEKTDNINA